MTKQIPPGYKQTKVGIIPKDWEVARLGDVATVETGKTPLRSNKSYWNNGVVNWATTTEVNDAYIFSTNEQITSLAVHELKMKVLPINTILLAMYGQGKTRGKVALLKIESTINQAFASIKPNKNYSTNFVFNFLVKSYEEIRELSHGSNQDNLNLDIVKSIKIPFPALKEQEKIAEILSTWDEEIDKQEQLIEQKQAFKKGIMQQIFSQKIRFKDDHGNDYPAWQHKQLGMIGDTYNGLSGKTKDDFGIGSPYITYKQIFDSITIDIDKFEYVKINENEKQSIVKYGDAFFTTSSETPEEVGMSSLYLSNIDTSIYLNSFCFGYRFNHNILFPQFARYLFRSHNFRSKVMELAQGSTRFNISKNQMMKISDYFPYIGEQIKIADFLTNIDDEITKQTEILEQLKLQKQSLMQKLLTGQVRVSW